MCDMSSFFSSTLEVLATEGAPGPEGGALIESLMAVSPLNYEMEGPTGRHRQIYGQRWK